MGKGRLTDLRHDDHDEGLKEGVWLGVSNDPFPHKHAGHATTQTSATQGGSHITIARNLVWSGIQPT